MSGDSCTDVACVDLVAAQLDRTRPTRWRRAARHLHVPGQLGDVSTAARPRRRRREPLRFFDLFGDVTIVTPTSSNPAVTA